MCGSKTVNGDVTLRVGLIPKDAGFTCSCSQWHGFSPEQRIKLVELKEISVLCRMCGNQRRVLLLEFLS